MLNRILFIQALLWCSTLSQEELDFLSTEATKVARELINYGELHGTTNRLDSTDIYKSCKYSAKVVFGQEIWRMNRLISGLTFQPDEDDLELYLSGTAKEVEFWAFGKIEMEALLRENIEITSGRKQQESCLFGFRSCNLWPGYPKSCFTKLSVDGDIEVYVSMHATNIAVLPDDSTGKTKVCFNVEPQFTKESETISSKIFTDSDNNNCATAPKILFPGKPVISDFLDEARKDNVKEGLEVFKNKLQEKLGVRKCIPLKTTQTVGKNKSIPESTGNCPAGYARLPSKHVCQKTFGTSKPKCSNEASGAYLVEKKRSGRKVYYCRKNMKQAQAVGKIKFSPVTFFPIFKRNEFDETKLRKFDFMIQ